MEFKSGTLYLKKDGQYIPFSGVVGNITIESEDSPTCDISTSLRGAKGGSFSIEATEDALLDILAIVQTFIVGDPMLFIQLDMNDFYENTWFISYPYCEKNTSYMVKDVEMKKSLYRFVKNNPDRCWHGKKKIKEDVLEDEEI